VLVVKRFHAIVEGKVQGVFYRASAQKQAMALGVCGFIRNLNDGRVELEAQGEETALAQFLTWCHKGPPGSHVERLETRWLTAQSLFQPEFRILS